MMIPASLASALPASIPPTPEVPPPVPAAEVPPPIPAPPVPEDPPPALVVAPLLVVLAPPVPDVLVLPPCPLVVLPLELVLSLDPVLVEPAVCCGLPPHPAATTTGAALRPRSTMKTRVT